MPRKSLLASIYYAISGIAAMGFGILEMVITFTSGVDGVIWGPLEISGLWLWWRAIILFSAGVIYLSAIKNCLDIHQLAKSVVASIMILIVSGMEVVARVAGSVPGEEGGPWFNPPAVFLATYAPPYMPEIFLLPLSLLVFAFIYRRKKTTGDG